MIRCFLATGAAVLVALVAYTPSTAAAGAAPASGSLSTPQQQVRWQGSFKDTAGVGPEGCAIFDCHEFRLDVNLPRNVWRRPGGVQVGIRWPLQEENKQDLDLYVYGPTGSLVARSDGFFASSAESVVVDSAANGVYRVVVVPRYTTRDGLSYEGLAELERLPAVEPVRPLRPNLVSLQARNIRFAIGAYLFDPELPATESSSCYPEEIIEQGARRCLRFDQIIANLGQGPLELHYRLNGIATDRQLRQRIYRSNGSFSDRLADNYEFHPTHAHFHYKGFAQSRLWASDSSGQKLGAGPVRVGRKNGFCAIDIANVWWGRKGDAGRNYYFPNCHLPENGAGEPALRQGISVGWADVYNWYLAGQYIEVSGLADGYYLLETEADPNDTLVEGDETDNTSTTLIQLCGNRAEVVGREPPCKP